MFAPSMKNGRFSSKKVSNAEVDGGRVDFHLAEIRVDGAVERQAAADAVFQVGAGAGERARAVVERVAVLRLDVLGTAHDVGHQLDSAVRSDAVEAIEVSHP